jgi:hypothetical protein
MMKPDNRQNATEEALKTMGILDALEPLEVRLQFRVRLMERIERESLTGRLNHAGSGALINYRFAFIVLLIIVNVSSALVVVFNTTERSAPLFSDLRTTISDDYSSPTFAYYEQPAAYSHNTETMEPRTP